MIGLTENLQDVGRLHDIRDGHLVGVFQINEAPCLTSSQEMTLPWAAAQFLSQQSSHLASQRPGGT